MKYGIYDTRDNCWIGDEQGPKLYTEEHSAKANGMPVEVLAQIAAQVVEEQLGYGLGRLRAIPFEEGELRMKDTVNTRMSFEEALARVEGE